MQRRSPAATGISPVQRKPSLNICAGLPGCSGCSRSFVPTPPVPAYGPSRYDATVCTFDAGTPAAVNRSSHASDVSAANAFTSSSRKASLASPLRKLSWLGGSVGISFLSSMMSARPSTRAQTLELAKRVGGGRDPAVGCRKRVGARAADEPAIADALWCDAGEPVVCDHAAHQQARRIDHRHVEHDLALIATRAAQQRRRDRLRRRHAGCDVDHRKTDLDRRRLRIVALQRHHAGRRLDDVVIGRPRRVRAHLPPARDRAVDQFRIDAPAVAPASARAWPPCRDENSRRTHRRSRPVFR